MQVDKNWLHIFEFVKIVLLIGSFAHRAVGRPELQLVRPSGLFFVPAVNLTILTHLILRSSTVSLSYFILTVTVLLLLLYLLYHSYMCKCSGEQSCMCSTQPSGQSEWYLLLYEAKRSLLEPMLHLSKTKL